MIKVKNSSFIASMDYNEARQDLKVSMKNGSEYVYTPVTAKFWEFIQSYNSKGEAYNAVIKRNKALTSYKLLK